MPSKYEKKRKRDLEADTTGQTAREDEHRRRTDRRRSKSRSRSPSKKSSAKKHKQREESTQDRRDSGGDRNDESLSIEETNKLRAKLGLAPLELEDKSNTQPVEKEDGSGDKVFTEDGVEIVHKPSRNWSDEKRQKDLKEKLDLKKKQRDVYSKVLKKRKGLAEESEDEEEISNTVKWVERNRLLEEQMRKAQEKAKQLDEMDEAFGIGGMLQEEQQKQRASRQLKKEAALTGGLVVGHSVQDFSEGRETVLVLQDKSILDDDDEEEVLINPNMLENERHKLMVERRKKKATHYQAYEEEEMDEFGQVKRPDILAKYNEGMDGEEKKRERFRLNESGQYELDKEVAEAEARHRLMMMNKKFESLESTKYTLAKEFYTEEEVIQFRRPKKGKSGKNVRKKKTLKADDLLELVAEPLEETPEERRAKEAKLAARRAERGESEKQFRETLKTVKNGDEGGKMVEVKEEVEEGELLDSMGDKQRQKANKLPVSPPEQMHPPPASSTATESSGKEKWKKPQASVNVKLLQSLADKIKKGNRDEQEEEEDSDDEEDLPHATNVAPMRIEDEAEDELNSMLAKARRLRQAELMAAKDRMPTIKEEAGSSDEEEEDEANGFGSTSAAIIFDATSEKYKSIGGGAYEAGRKGKATTTKEVKMEVDDEEDQLMGGFMEEAQSSVGRKKHRKGKGSERDHGHKRRRESSASDSDSDFERMEEEREGGSQRPASSQSESGTSSADLPTSTNILGEEKDVTKGVGAMLKLAGEKGYLGNRGRLAGDGSLKHLESKRYSKVDQGRYDIEDKTMRKLERMGTTGTGPTRPFPEKQDYTPKIEINYSDKSGRVLEPKEAFRVLSWKFHGKGPGKKQAEKHTMKVVKREKLKKMNSQDTPLGTLNKQLKKQEQLQAPYLVLSGRGDAAPLQKE